MSEGSRYGSSREMRKHAIILQCGIFEIKRIFFRLRLQCMPGHVEFSEVQLSDLIISRQIILRIDNSGYQRLRDNLSCPVVLGE